MPDDIVSVDEYLNSRREFVKSGDVLVKASKAPSTWDEKTRTARFVMSAEVEDLDRDIVVQAGIDIDQFRANPIAPFSHRSNDFPIGSWSNIEKVLSGRPKRTEGDLTLVPEGKDGVADRLAFHIASGTIKACSIGFIPKTIRRREKPQDPEGYSYPGYMIEECILIECSPCAIPANPSALAKSAAEGDVLAKEIIEEVLDTWVKTEAGLLMPRAEFEAVHKQATGERTSVIASPPGGAEGEPAPRSLIRRAIDAITGKTGLEEAEAHLRDGMREVATELALRREAEREAENERVAKLVYAEMAHKRFMRRHAANERLAALKGRMEAKSLV